MEKDKIILAISFITTYPTSESYIKAYDSYLKLDNYKDNHIFEREWKKKRIFARLLLKMDIVILLSNENNL